MLTLGCPAFNEEESIEAVLKEAFDVLPTVIPSFEVLVIDDGSTDSTPEILERLSSQQSRLRVVRHPRNLGAAGFGRTVVEQARGEWMAVISADGEVNPLSLAPMLEQARKGADIVVGTRKQKDDYTGYRKIVSWTFNRSVQLVFGTNFQDIGGFKLYRTDVVRQIDVIANSAFLNAERLVKAERIGYRIDLVPIEYRHRHGGKAKGASRRWVTQSTLDLGLVARDVLLGRWIKPTALPRTSEHDI